MRRIGADGLADAKRIREAARAAKFEKRMGDSGEKNHGSSGKGNRAGPDAADIVHNTEKELKIE